MQATHSPLRPLLLSVLAVAVLGVSGCSWLRKGNPEYAMSAETRPLEVPPDLTLPNTAGAMQLPQTGVAPSAAGAPGAASSTTGFNVTAGRDEVFAQVGAALDGTDGLTVASRSQLLGTFDVSYQDSNFLVRVVAVEAGTYVSAVDPRGLPASGPAASALVAELRGKLGN